MGGSQYQAKCLIDRLISEGAYDITYLTRNFNAAYRPNGYKIINVGSQLNVMKGLFFDAPNLLKFLKRIHPDVIYQRVGCAYSGIAAYYARHNRCNMVWHVASNADVIPFKFRLSRNVVRRYIDKKFLEYGVRHATHIVVQTHDQAILLGTYYGRSPSALVYNFHPLPTEMIQKSEPIRIVWIANLKPLKQPELFVSLARDLQELDGVQFVMIGSLQGARHWRRAIMRDMANTKNLVHLGAKNQDVVNAILASGHILVHTSRMEGFANTFIQAWMRQVPVVSLSINPDKILDDNRIGFCSGSYEKLKEDVLTLIENTDLRHEIGKRAQTYAFKHHSEDNIEKLLEVFDMSNGPST